MAGREGVDPGSAQQTVFGWAQQLPPPPPPPKALGVPGRETRAVPIAPALAQVRGGRVGLGRVCVGSTLPSISGPQPGQNQGGVASSRLLAAASTRLPSLPAAQRLEHRVSEVSEKA